MLVNGDFTGTAGIESCVLRLFDAGFGGEVGGIF
jgi:hypothetical protein